MNGYKIGSPSDPWKSRYVMKYATKTNGFRKFLNKKVVRIVGHVKGLMCVHKRPRLQVIFKTGTFIFYFFFYPRCPFRFP